MIYNNNNNGQRSNGSSCSGGKSSTSPGNVSFTFWWAAGVDAEMAKTGSSAGTSLTSISAPLLDRGEHSGRPCLDFACHRRQYSDLVQRTGCLDDRNHCWLQRVG